MTIIIEEVENVAVRREAFSDDIRIRGNPEDTMSGVILLELKTLEYHNDVLTHTTPLGSGGETVGEFVQREFNVNGKTITGLDLMLTVKQYVRDLHDERIAASVPHPVSE